MWCYFNIIKGEKEPLTDTVSATHTVHTDHLILENAFLLTHIHADLAHIMSCFISPSVFLLYLGSFRGSQLLFRARLISGRVEREGEVVGWCWSHLGNHGLDKGTCLYLIMICLWLLHQEPQVVRCLEISVTFMLIQTLCTYVATHLAAGPTQGWFTNAVTV